MEAVAMSPSSVSSHIHEASSSTDDMSLQEGLLFSDTLKDLRNLRSQLYSAAEYFEVFYQNNSHKSTGYEYANRQLTRKEDLNKLFSSRRQSTTGVTYYQAI
nr:unnamed protein product [Digitaria exilis]